MRCDAVRLSARRNVGGSGIGFRSRLDARRQFGDGSMEMREKNALSVHTKNVLEVGNAGLIKKAHSTCIKSVYGKNSLHGDLKKEV